MPRLALLTLHEWTFTINWQLTLLHSRTQFQRSLVPVIRGDPFQRNRHLGSQRAHDVRTGAGWRGRKGKARKKHGFWHTYDVQGWDE